MNEKIDIASDIEYLESIMRQHNIKLSAIAKQADLSHTTLTRWYGNPVRPLSRDSLKKIQHAFSNKSTHENVHNMNNKLNIELGNRIKELLKKNKQTQTALAKHCNVEPPTVNIWISGKNRPMLPRIEKIAEFLGTTSEWLITGKGSIDSSVFDLPETAVHKEAIMGIIDGVNEYIVATGARVDLKKVGKLYFILYDLMIQDMKTKGDKDYKPPALDMEKFRDIVQFALDDNSPDPKKS